MDKASSNIDSVNDPKTIISPDHSSEPIGNLNQDFESLNLDQKFEKLVEMKLPPDEWEEDDKPYVKEIKISMDKFYLFVCMKYLGMLD